MKGYQHISKYSAYIWFKMFGLLASFIEYVSRVLHVMLSYSPTLSILFFCLTFIFLQCSLLNHSRQVPVTTVTYNRLPTRSWQLCRGYFHRTGSLVTTPYITKVSLARKLHPHCLSKRYLSHTMISDRDNFDHH